MSEIEVFLGAIERIGGYAVIAVVLAVSAWRFIGAWTKEREGYLKLDEKRLERDSVDRKETRDFIALNTKTLENIAERLVGLGAQNENRDQWLTSEFQSISDDNQALQDAIKPLAREVTLTTYAEDTKSAVTNLTNVAKATFEAIKSFEALYASKNADNADEIQAKLEAIDKRLTALVKLTESIVDRIQKNEEKKQNAQDTSDSPTVFIASPDTPALPDDGKRTDSGNGDRGDGTSGV